MNSGSPCTSSGIFLLLVMDMPSFQELLGSALKFPAFLKSHTMKLLNLCNHISEILNEMCKEDKRRMRHLDGEELGSWERAVLRSDGVWHTQGHFSKNGSFIILH